jgi:hypothetical protein
MFEIPTVIKNSDVITPEGVSVLAIRIGGKSTNSNLQSEGIGITNPAKITFENMTGMKAAYANEININSNSDGINNNNITLTNISIICDSKNNPTNIPENGECYFDDGTDLTIWTYHFSIFSAYNPNSMIVEEQEPPATPAEQSALEDDSSSGGSGGGGGAAGSLKVIAGKDGCSENWVCTSWTDCSKGGSRTRMCKDENNCGSNQKKPAAIQFCTPLNMIARNNSKALFDIIVDIVDEPSDTSQILLTKITLVNFGSPDLVNADLEYTIRDIDKTLIRQFHKVVPVKTQREFMDSINTSGLANGKYYLTIELTYTGQEFPAKAEKTFDVGASNILGIFRGTNTAKTTGAIVAMIALIVLYSFYVRARRALKAGEEIVDNTPKKEEKVEESEDEEKSESKDSNEKDSSKKRKRKKEYLID